MKSCCRTHAALRARVHLNLALRTVLHHVHTDSRQSIQCLHPAPSPSVWLMASHRRDTRRECLVGGAGSAVTLSRTASRMASKAGSPTLCWVILKWPNPRGQCAMAATGDALLGPFSGTAVQKRCPVDLSVATSGCRSCACGL